MRTLTQILIDCDNANEECEVKVLWKEIVSNKKKYPLCELHFAQEHMQEKIERINTGVKKCVPYSEDT